MYLRPYVEVKQSNSKDYKEPRIPIRREHYSNMEDPHSLIEKPVCCAQLLCDGCPLRLGGDSGATARALSVVQNDMYTTGVMMQS
jgi:hypothetical protein